jgi:hypothetical protein
MVDIPNTTCGPIATTHPKTFDRLCMDVRGGAEQNWNAPSCDHHLAQHAAMADIL